MCKFIEGFEVKDTVYSVGVHGVKSSQLRGLIQSTSFKHFVIKILLRDVSFFLQVSHIFLF